MYNIKHQYVILKIRIKYKEMKKFPILTNSIFSQQIPKKSIIVKAQTSKFTIQIPKKKREEEKLGRKLRNPQ